MSEGHTLVWAVVVVLLCSCLVDARCESPLMRAISLLLCKPGCWLAAAPLSDQELGRQYRRTCLPNSDPAMLVLTAGSCKTPLRPAGP